MTSKGTQPRVAVIIVAHGHAKGFEKLLKLVLRAKSKYDQLIVVDNHPEHYCARIARSLNIDKVIESENKGFGAACNLAANQAKKADLIYFLNPDTEPLEGWLDEVKEAYTKTDWAAWMSLLLLPNGKVNSAGTAVHVTGVSWADHFGEPASNFKRPMERHYISGACLAIRTKVWREVGGFSTDYFVYYEDTELCTRLLIRGYKLGLWPGSKIIHDYSFNKGQQKLFYLERNRYLLLTTLWPIPLLIMLSPLLLLAELGLWLVSLVQGRLTLRLKSYLAFLGFLPMLRTLRRSARKGNRIGWCTFAKTLRFALPKMSRISE